MQLDNIIQTIKDTNQEDINLTEDELNIVYFYLDYALEEFSLEEQLFWKELIEKIDP